ncbi:MAG: elongation factor P [bacterium]|nr:elongation factor P [bacterium]
MARASEIQKGLAIVFKNEPHLVVDFQHVNPGKGAAFVRARLKSLKTGKVIENTYKSEESIEFVELERKKVQYLYGGQNEYTFMDMVTYEQFSLNGEIVGPYASYLKENMEVTLLLSDSVPVTVDFPKKVTLKVTEAPPAVRGDTATNVTKEITLENGLKIKTPMFIKEGDMVIINTETGEYVERFTA